MPSTALLWRRLDQPGHDAARVVEGPSGAVIEGSAVFDESRRPCRLDYRVVCDDHWRTRSARVVGWVGVENVHLEIAVDASARWTVNGMPSPGVYGCVDVDLSFTPATNLLAIRRTRLAIGARADVRAAWLRFPELALEPLYQRYERLAESRYKYECWGGAFTAVLETNETGAVTRYPGLWQLESAG